MNLPIINTVQLIGRVSGTVPIEFRYSKEGYPVCTFNIIVNRQIKEIKETDDIPVIAWNSMASTCMEKLERGDPVYLFCSLRKQKWTDNDGRIIDKIQCVISKIQFLKDERE
jgi:single-stranded DNA-binding protein